MAGWPRSCRLGTGRGLDKLAQELRLRAGRGLRLPRRQGLRAGLRAETTGS